MRVPQIMDADSLHACFLCTEIHCAVQTVLGEQEHPIRLLDCILFSNAATQRLIKSHC